MVAGLVLVGVGGATLFVPASFHATNGIDLGGNSSLLSETRAAGGMLLAAGALILSGAFVARLAFIATVLGALGYLSYSFARLLSFALDGLPASGLILATFVELALGLACALALIRYRHDTAAGRSWTA